MKKLFLVIVLLVSSFGLVACGGEDITPEKTPSIINENVLEEQVLEEEVLEEQVLEEEVLEENVIGEEVLEEQVLEEEVLEENVIGEQVLEENVVEEELTNPYLSLYGKVKISHDLVELYRQGHSISDHVELYVYSKTFGWRMVNYENKNPWSYISISHHGYDYETDGNVVTIDEEVVFTKEKLVEILTLQIQTFLDEEFFRNIKSVDFDLVDLTFMLGEVALELENYYYIISRETIAKEYGISDASSISSISRGYVDLGENRKSLNYYDDTIRRYVSIGTHVDLFVNIVRGGWNNIKHELQS